MGSRFLKLLHRASSTAEDCAKQIFDSNLADFGDYKEVKFKRNVKNMIAYYLSGKSSLKIPSKTPTKAKIQGGANDGNKVRV